MIDKKVFKEFLGEVKGVEKQKKKYHVLLLQVLCL